MFRLFSERIIQLVGWAASFCPTSFSFTPDSSVKLYLAFSFDLERPFHHKPPFLGHIGPRVSPTFRKSIRCEWLLIRRWGIPHYVLQALFELDDICLTDSCFNWCIELLCTCDSTVPIVYNKWRDSHHL